MFENSTKKNDYLNIIIDIRNSSAAIAFWEYLKNEPTIIYADRQYILLEQKNNLESFVKNIYKTLDQVLSRVSRSELTKHKKFKKIGLISCFLSSPWYEAEIKNLNIKEKRATNFSKDYLDKRLKTIFDQTKDNNKIEIEDKIISISLNGYEIVNPYNKSFEEAKISAYRSFINKNVYKYLKRKINDNFNYKNLNFYSHPLTIVSVLKYNYYSINDFSLFDISGETTDVLNSTEGSINNLNVIPNGFNFLIRELSLQTNETKNSTFSKIKMLVEGDIEDNKLDSQLIEISKKYFEILKNQIQNNNLKINQNIFLAVDQDFGPIIKRIFGQKNFYSDVLSLNKEPLIRIINSNNTKDLAKYDENIEKDSLISIFFNFQQLILNKIC